MANQQFLVLSSEISKPFVIPNVSPVSANTSPNSRANSVSSVSDSQRRPSVLL